MLHSHPRIGIAPETRHLLPAYRNRRRFGNLEDPANRRALAKFIVRRGHFPNLGLEREPTVRQIVEGPPTLGSALGIILRAYADRFDRSRWGEKRPAYHRRIDVLMRLFPDVQIVHIVRDPRDCVASLKRMPWWERGVEHSVSGWAQSIDYTDEAMRRWPGAVIRVQYERLVTDPETELKALCAALGEDYDPAMVEPERLASEVVPGKDWNTSVRVAPTTEHIGGWRRALEPWEVALCERALGERMARFGYELAGPGRPRVNDLVRYTYVHTTRGLLRRAQRVKDQWQQRFEPNPVAALLTSGQLAAAAETAPTPARRGATA